MPRMTLARFHRTSRRGQDEYRPRRRRLYRERRLELDDPELPGDGTALPQEPACDDPPHAGAARW